MFGYVSVVSQVTHPAHGYCRSEYPYRRELSAPGAEVLAQRVIPGDSKNMAHRATGALYGGRSHSIGPGEGE